MAGPRVSQQAGVWPHVWPHVAPYPPENVVKTKAPWGSGRKKKSILQGGEPGARVDQTLRGDGYWRTLVGGRGILNKPPAEAGYHNLGGGDVNDCI